MAGRARKCATGAKRGKTCSARRGKNPTCTKRGKSCMNHVTTGFRFASDWLGSKLTASIVLQNSQEKLPFIFVKSVTLIVFYFAEKPISIRERFISTLDGINANTWSILQTSATKSRWWDWCVHKGMFKVILTKGDIVAQTLQMQIHWKLVVLSSLSIHPSEWLLCSPMKSLQNQKTIRIIFSTREGSTGRNRPKEAKVLTVQESSWAKFIQEQLSCDIFTASVTRNLKNRKWLLYINNM